MTKFLRFPAVLAVAGLIGCAHKDDSTVPDMPPPPSTPPPAAYNYEPATANGLVGADAGVTTEPLTASGDYTVKPGDSLWKIARDHNTSVAKITALNGFTNDVIRAGQVIKLP